MTVFVCPDCGKKCRAADGPAGKAGRCPACARPAHVPADARREPAGGPAEAVTARELPARPRHSGRPLAAALVAGVLLSALALTALIYSLDRRQQAASLEGRTGEGGQQAGGR